MPEATSPEEFDAIFRQGVLIVGGHAVNLWARYYSNRGDQELKQFAPFVSKDADIHLRDKALAAAIATAAEWKFRENPEPRSPILGHIYLVREGRELTVDVLHTVTGLTDDDLAATEQIEFADGRRYSVPAPEIMLKAKLANLARHSQDDRQDARHVQIMVACCHHYLVEAYSAMARGDLPEREAVERFMATHRITNEPDSRALDAQHNLRLSFAVPQATTLTALPRFERLSAFYQHQVRRIGPRISM